MNTPHILSQQSATDLHPQDSFDYKSLENINLEKCREVESDLIKELIVLEKALLDPDFGRGPSTIGSELEIFLINNELSPSMVNTEICKHVDPNKFQTEISRFCLEYNGPVLELNNQAFNNLTTEMQAELCELRKFTKDKLNTNLAMIGILPTLTTNDLGMDAFTPHWRYFAMDKIIRSMRKDHDFVLDIEGENSLFLKWYNTLLEGVNTSYQVHLRVNPQDFNNYYNAAQLIAPFVLSLSGNSPLLFGHQLWEESRIAVFEQVVNNKSLHLGSLLEQDRVSFGRGWINNGAFGLLKEACELFYPVFTKANSKCSKDDSSASSGPNLSYIAQHNSTIWPWNRAVYDKALGGHFRIEMRYLPAGPTIADMVANTAFMIGLVKYFSNDMPNIISKMPFKYAQYNFCQAAQYGLKANCIWPCVQSQKLKESPVTDLLADMIKFAGEGLHALGVTELEIMSMQNIIQQRLESQITGAIWQKTIYNKFINKKFPPDIALKEMFRLYLVKQDQGIPVALWRFDT